MHINDITPFDIAQSNSTEILRLKEKIGELEKRIDSLDKDMNTAFEALNAHANILYLKQKEDNDGTQISN